MLMPSKYRSEHIVIIPFVSAIMLLLVFLAMQPTQHVLGVVEHSSSFTRPSFSTSSLFSIDRVANASHDHNMMSSSSMNNSSDANGTLTVVTISNNGSFLPHATYSVSSYPTSIGSKTNFTIIDDGPEDTNKVTRGIISIPRLRHGNYLVTELKAPEGYVVDKVSKVIQIGSGQSSASATFTSDMQNQDQQKNSSQIKSITYTAKFECGSIIGNEGPLRPGHYDTDISIFNRQEYPINILLNVIINGGANTNALVKTIQPQTSIGIVCKDVRQFFGIGNNSKQLIEGFAIVRLEVNGGVVGSLSSSGGGGGTVIQSSPVTVDDINNFLDVQVFYTANALEFLPHEILVKDIVFSILNDTSSKIPRSLLMKPLDITLQSQINEMSDPESKVREILSEKYDLSGNDLTGLRIRIINLSIAVAAMIDDHAISSSVVRPEASS
jgi:hypothetical protein